MIVSDWIESAREHLGGGVVEQVNRLAASYTPGDSALTMQYDLAGLAQGVPLAAGLNCFMVWATEPATKQVEITPGWAGAPVVALAQGDVVRVRPAQYTHRIFGAINDTLTELSSPLQGVFGVDSTDIQYNSMQSLYDLSTAEEVDDVLRVSWGDVTDDQDLWPELGFQEWDYRSVTPNVLFPSGKQLVLRTDEIATGSTLRVTFRRRLGLVDALNDNVSQTFLADSAWDIPPLGAAARLSMSGEWRRNRIDAQGDTRRAQEVPAGAMLGGARALQAMYQRRVEQEASRLMNLYPPKMR